MPVARTSAAAPDAAPDAASDAVVAFLADIASTARIDAARRRAAFTRRRAAPQDDDYAYGGRDPAAALREILALGLSS